MRKFILSVIILVTSSFGLHAQTVGVTLSGGGAKGLYHIGILKALEENGIPIDYITGTSMGAIIAGLYAAGYSPDDIIHYFCNDNVSGWVTGKIEDKYTYYYNQLPPRPQIFATDLNLKLLLNKRSGKSDQIFNMEPFSSLSGTNIIPSTQLDIGLLGYFSAANSHSKGDFDKLFVPFRCVASNVVKKQQYIWEKGDLALAIRSSMALPIIFSSVKVDSMILFDGGVYNNFPWKEMDEEFHPDVIIGGKCLGGVELDQGTLAGQMELMIMHRTDYDIPKEKGFLIDRNVETGLLDFSNPMKPIMEGYEDAMAQMDSIKKRVTRRVDPSEVGRRRLEYKKQLSNFSFSGSSVENLNRISMANRKIKIVDSVTMNNVLIVDTSVPNRRKEIKKVYSFDEMKEVYYGAINDRNMKADFPKANYNPETGLFDLDVTMRSSPVFKIRAGLNISSSSINQAYLGFQYNDNRRNSGIYSVDGYLGSFYNSVEGTTRHNFYDNKLPFYLLNTITYNYLDYSRANNQRLTFEKMRERATYISNDLFFSSTFGFRSGRTHRTTVSASIGRDAVKYNNEQNLSIIKNNGRAKNNYISVKASLDADNLNYPTYATRGQRQSLSAMFSTMDSRMKPLFDKEYYDRPGEPVIHKKYNWFGTKFSREWYNSLFKHFSIGYKIDAVYSNMPEMESDYLQRAYAPIYTPTEYSKTLFMPEYQKPSYYAVGVMPILELNDKLYLKMGAFIYKGDILEYEFFKETLRYNFNAALVFQSPIGPISLSYDYFDIDSAKRSYIVFNFGFMLFNKRGISY